MLFFVCSSHKASSFQKYSLTYFCLLWKYKIFFKTIYLSENWMFGHLPTCYLQLNENVLWLKCILNAIGWMFKCFLIHLS